MAARRRLGHATKRLSVVVAINLTILAVLLTTVEGLASYALFAKDVLVVNLIAERKHTKYDADLGWVNIPRLNIADMYGPGIYLKTNALGFRNDDEIDIEVPEGKRRVICSGDSFTLGYGVANDKTWCQRLGSIDPQIEPVNMGQGGYGVDQAYLWFKRDGSKLAHQIHLLAFITNDFARMQSDRFLGYPKPVLHLSNGALTVRNVPVPELSYNFPRLAHFFQYFETLRTVQFFRGLLSKLGFSAKRHDTKRTEENRRVVFEVFQDLKNFHEQHGSRLMLVYLPTTADLRGNRSNDSVAFIEQTADTLDIPFINLIDAFRKIPYEAAVDLFLKEGQVDYPGAAGHFNDRGNEIVAEMIYSHL